MTWRHNIPGHFILLVVGLGFNLAALAVAVFGWVDIFRGKKKKKKKAPFITSNDLIFYCLQ